MARGRMTKLTPGLQTAICNAVEGGIPFANALLLAGVSEFTGLEWLRRGEGRHDRPATPIYAQFAQAIARARAQDEARRVLRINQAGKGGAVVYRKTTDTLNRTGEVVKRVTEERYKEP